MVLVHFVIDAIREMLRGPRGYWMWLLLLWAIFGFGAWNYSNQLEEGLVITGLSDQVSWGFYIANFAFLVGVAAAAVLLVIPAYVFHREDVKAVVLLGEGMAVAAVIMAILFVFVDIGRPDRAWHAVPFLGRFNFPNSLLAWDIIVLNGYLALNLLIPFYVHYNHYRGRQPNLKRYFPFVVLAMFWAISIHTVTAFLFSANSARPFWNTALLGPRFIASAFASGPAIIILTLLILRRVTGYRFSDSVVDTLALIMMLAMQINIFFVIAEVFTDFYNQSWHAAHLHYLFVGLQGFASLRPAIWLAIGLNLVAVVILTITPLRKQLPTLITACIAAYIGIWLEKGMGLVIPGFVPTPLGEVFEYAPTHQEFFIATGIWAFGFLIFTLLAKASIAIELGMVRFGGGNTNGEAQKGQRTTYTGDLDPSKQPRGATG